MDIHYFEVLLQSFLNFSDRILVVKVKLINQPDCIWYPAYGHREWLDK